MKYSIPPIRAAILSAFLMAGTTFAQQNAPYDFSYKVTGKATLKPSLVFNDGSDTYIQLSPGVEQMTVVGAPSGQQGPYLVIQGLPSEFSLRDSKRQTVTVQYVGTSAQQRHEAGGSRVPPQYAPTSPAPEANTHVPQEQAINTPATQSAVVQNPFYPARSNAAPGCATKAVVSNSTIAVEFVGSSKKLSDGTIERLKKEASKPGFERVTIMTAPEDANALRTQRGISIGKAMLNAGVSKNQISNGGHSHLPGMYSIEFEFKNSFPCSENGPIVVFDDGKLSVFANDNDLTVVGERIAKAMKLGFVIDGEPTPTPITANFAMTPYREGLARIGENIAGKADLVLRDKEITIRYLNKK